MSRYVMTDDMENVCEALLIYVFPILVAILTFWGVMARVLLQSVIGVSA
jgi:hypothetical protein